MANEDAKREQNRKTVSLGVTDDASLDIVMFRVDPTSKRLKVDASVSGSVGSSSIGDGTRTVTTAGTRVQLSASSVPCARVYIQAHESNSGTVVIGGITVVGALSGRRGAALFPTQSQVFNVSNLNLLYVDSTANGDIVNFYYEV